ncbi:MAG: hypothetical protein LBF93_07600 [Zoogloeaceae bacterium]|jgi:hypothetical protein|nr:hypothetical protein [Zoogloeaceae bacterium]
MKPAPAGFFVSVTKKFHGGGHGNHGETQRFVMIRRSLTGLEGGKDAWGVFFTTSKGGTK